MGPRWAPGGPPVGPGPPVAICNCRSCGHSTTSPPLMPNTNSEHRTCQKKSLEATRPHQRDGMYRLCIYTMWGPQDSVQLVQTTPITMVYASYNYTYWCLYTWKFPKLRVSPAIIHFKFGVSMKLTIQLLGSPIYGNPSYIHMYIYIYSHNYIYI